MVFGLHGGSRRSEKRDHELLRGWEGAGGARASRAGLTIKHSKVFSTHIFSTTVWGEVLLLGICEFSEVSPLSICDMWLWSPLSPEESPFGSKCPLSSTKLTHLRLQVQPYLMYFMDHSTAPPYLFHLCWEHSSPDLLKQGAQPSSQKTSFPRVREIAWR